jgi:CubicO group peptidase (beta-lactamase class C family)
MQMNLIELDASIERARFDWNVPGLAVAIVQNNDVIFAKGYGVRTQADPAPVDEQTVFAIASCTKAFTAATIALLVDDGKVALDDPVTAYLPDFQLYDPSVTREITVRDLLCHRSGLPKFGGDLLWFGTTYSRDEILHRVRYLKPRSSFRSQFGYQNILYLAAGKIVEIVSGKSWDAFVRERIFTPLGMRSSTTSITDFKLTDPIAAPHIERDSALQAIPYLNVDNEAPAGGINSTIADITHWLKLQLGQGQYQNHQLISAKMIREMWSPQTIIAIGEQTAQLYPTTHFQAYGLGWFLRDYHGRKVIAHDGGLPGMASRVGLIPEEQLGFVILSNRETAITRVIQNVLIDSALGAPQRDWNALFLEQERAQHEQEQATKRAIDNNRMKDTRPSLPVTHYTGRFSGVMYGEADVYQEQDKLAIRLVPTPRLVGDLEHWHYDTFRVTWRDNYIPSGLVTFILDAQGKVTEMKIDSPNPDFDFKELEFRRVR